MKNYLNSGLILLALSMTLSSCELIGDLLRMGFYAGVIFVVIIIAVVVWIFSRFRRRR